MDATNAINDRPPTIQPEGLPRPSQESEYRNPNGYGVAMSQEPRSIGWAVKQLHHGRRVTRAGWNGKGMFLRLQVSDAMSKMTQPYVYMTYDGDQRIPWLCSQADLLATDWRVVD